MSSTDYPGIGDAADIEELAPLLRTGRLSRFRLLDVVCPRDHRLGQVLTTPRGPLFIAQAAVIHRDDDRPQPTTRHRAHVHAAFLDEAGDVTLPVQCRCLETVVAVPWLRDRLAEGKPRVALIRD